MELAKSYCEGGSISGATVSLVMSAIASPSIHRQLEPKYHDMLAESLAREAA
jgi:hypothetical protein